MNARSSGLMVARSVILAVIALACVASVSTAAAISYGDILGNTLMFQGVVEDSGTDSPPLYGAPDVAVDSLAFSPIGLVATSSLGAPPIDLTDGQLNANLVPLSGYYLNMVSVEEAGDYTLAGAGTIATKAEASGTLFFTILEVNGAAIAPVTISKSMVFTPKASGDFDLVNDPGVGIIWAGGVAIDVPVEAAAVGVTGMVTKARLAIDNTLLASSEPLSIAFIAKKQFTINVGTAIIPEPSTICLLGMGALGLFLGRGARRRMGLVAAVAAMAVLVGGAAIAAPISYGDKEADTVWFLNVTENSGTDPTPLFGAPLVVGDALVFSPISFTAYANNLNPPIDLTDGVLTTVITAKTGFTIPQVLVSETGDYTLAATGGSGTTATQVSVRTPTFITVLEVGGAAITPVSFSQSMVFTPNASGTFDVVNDAGIGVIWKGSALLDIDAFLAAKGIAGGATKVRFSMDNTLLAISEANTVAFIAKKEAEGVVISIIPEPSTFVLLAMGLVAMLVARLRRW